MYITVKLLNGFSRSLTYAVPPAWTEKNLIGAVVTVPLQQRKEQAIVIEQFAKFSKKPAYTIREASTLEEFPRDSHYYAFISKLCTYYLIEPATIYRRLKSFLKTKATTKTPISSLQEQTSSTLPSLTKEQEIPCTELIEPIKHGTFTPTLLQGVTGSGKTEVYKRLIMTACAAGKSSLFLLPEVSMATQFAHKLAQELPQIQVYDFHSASSAKTKKNLWKHLSAGQPCLIIGVHLPPLLPIPNLGLIIVDEEHEKGYQEKRHPRINSKEAAILRAQMYRIPIILGSATPTVCTIKNVQDNAWHHFKLTKRFSGNFPAVKLVKLDKQQRKSFWISRELEKAITHQLKNQEQTLIFINRRGHSFFIQCFSCGYICECPSCSVSLTLHSNNILRCHYCNYTKREPTTCPTCSATKFLKKGIGTQQVVDILEKLFPTARIARADMDTTVNKKNWQDTMRQFTQREIDILVGTQTITKGYHFPGVTLVGVIWGDIGLSIPFYTAIESTLQQLLQVAGRAGRQSECSQVIIQTIHDHPVFAHIREEQYLQFCEHELAAREKINYPPYVRFAEIELRHTKEDVLEQDSTSCADALDELNDDNLLILGPAEPPVAKIKNTYSRKIYLKAPSYKSIHKAAQKALSLDLSSQIFFTPNPQS